jgi:ATP-dependent Lon protease
LTKENDMLKEKLPFSLVDDTDFMPIIPMNEQESDQDKAMVIPNELPILPLRNTVLFPGVVLPITVGRDKSINAVTDVYKTDKLIGVIAQKDANIEEPQPHDLCRIGTVAKIVKLIKMPDGGTTLRMA